MAESSNRTAVTEAYHLMTGVAAADVDRIFALGRTIEVKDGDQLTAIGGQADRLYFVRRGRIRLTMPLSVRGDEREILIEEKGRGDAVGWSALVPPHHFTLNARASMASELIEIPGESLLRFLSTNRDIGFTVVSNMAQMIGRRLLTVQTMWVRAMQRTVEGLDRNA